MDWTRRVTFSSFGIWCTLYQRFGSSLFQWLRCLSPVSSYVGPGHVSSFIWDTFTEIVKGHFLYTWEESMPKYPPHFYRFNWWHFAISNPVASYSYNRAICLFIIYWWQNKPLKINFRIRPEQNDQHFQIHYLEWEFECNKNFTEICP